MAEKDDTAGDSKMNPAGVAASAVEAGADKKTAAGQGASTDLPLEGESRWVGLMRLLALATIIVILAIGAMFYWLTGEDSFGESQQLAAIMGGIVFLLVLEYFIFLLVVIPRQADYGRYVIHQGRVDYYPLTALGLSVGRRARPVHIGRFVGLATSRMMDRRGNPSFAVYLMHADDRGKTININNFPTLPEADAFAAALGRKLGLRVVSGARRPGELRADKARHR